jgi:hypothetical protein
MISGCIICVQISSVLDVEAGKTNGMPKETAKGEYRIEITAGTRLL